MYRKPHCLGLEDLISEEKSDDFMSTISMTQQTVFTPEGYNEHDFSGRD
jgi:hypothetical protein